MAMLCLPEITDKHHELQKVFGAMTDSATTLYFALIIRNISTTGIPLTST